MEEVDNITLQTLRALGCSIDDSVSSVAQLSADALVEATAVCLERSRADLAEDGLPRRLPPSLSARFSVAQRLAQLIKEGGYKADLGYQTFLYPNERDTRNLLMHLVEHLPKDSVHVADEMLSSSAALAHVISAAVSARLASPWLPWYCRSSARRASRCARRLLVAEPPPEEHPLKDTISRVAARVPSVVRQARPDAGFSLAKSLLERSADLLATEHLGGEAAIRTAAVVAQQQLAKEVRREVSVAAEAATKEQQQLQRSQALAASKSAAAAASSDVPDDVIAEGAAPESAESREERRQRQEAETAEAGAALAEAEQRLERLAGKRNKLAQRLAAAGAACGAIRERCRQLEEEAGAKRAMEQMLPAAADNVRQLERQLKEQQRQRDEMEAAWSAKSEPIVAEIAALKAQHRKQQAASQVKEAELADAKRQLQECGEEAQRRDDLLAKLRDQVAKLEAAPNRASYTRRILDIVSNIKKQKLEVDRVLAQTRGLQKEINALSGKLERTFAETDELLFRDARKDETVRKAYKLLASLHANCELLVATEEERGALLRETRELEEQADGQRRRTQEDQLETVLRDCDEMRGLNEQLKKALKGRLNA